MKALEFKTKIKSDKIVVPEKVQEFLKSIFNKEFRVIILVDEKEENLQNSYNELVVSQFLDGYVDEGAVYDDY